MKILWIVFQVNYSFKWGNDCLTIMFLDSIMPFFLILWQRKMREKYVAWASLESPASLPEPRWAVCSRHASPHQWTSLACHLPFSENTQNALVPDHISGCCTDPRGHPQPHTPLYIFWRSFLCQNEDLGSLHTRKNCVKALNRHIYLYIHTYVYLIPLILSILVMVVKLYGNKHAKKISTNHCCHHWDNFASKFMFSSGIDR